MAWNGWPSWKPVLSMAYLFQHIRQKPELGLLKRTWYFLMTYFSLVSSTPFTDRGLCCDWKRCLYTDIPSVTTARKGHWIICMAGQFYLIYQYIARTIELLLENIQSLFHCYSQSIWCVFSWLLLVFVIGTSPFTGIMSLYCFRYEL